MNVSLERDSASFVQTSDDISIGFRVAFDNIKEELDDHLIAINENTNEIQSNHAFLTELDGKIEKLKERIDQMQIFLQKHCGFVAEENKKFEISPLTKKEKDVFLMLYGLEESKGKVSYRALASHLGLTEELVCSYINNMIVKGVPIVKTYLKNRPYLRLNKTFRTMQTKENLLKIEQTNLKALL